MPGLDEVLSLRASGELAAALRALAAARGATVSDVLREAAEAVVLGPHACSGLCSQPPATMSAPVTWACGCGTPIVPSLTISPVAD